MQPENNSNILLQSLIGYSERVKELLPKIYGKTPKACVNTYGCQQNVSDSEHIKGMLVEMGYELTEEPSDADFVLFNTCAVRAHAEDRVFGNIGATKQQKREKKNTIIAVCGCMAQQQIIADRIKMSYPYVDMLFGTHVVHRLPEFIYRRLTGGGRIFEISDENNDIVEGIPVHRDQTLKGWLPIMHGCNNFCTYCIVPYVRGREVSRREEDVIAEAREMVAAGFKEIMLLGQNVNSYGKGLTDNVNFAGLLRKINAIEGDFRIRFMTSHPKDCTIELLDAIAECEKVERHLHLPFQSGSDRILKLMNRYYDSEKYLNLIKEAKKRIPDVTFTSDIIVGFPGETYEDFKETLRVVKEVRFASLFTFIYSPRNGTPAAKMDDPISRAEKGKWFSELLKVQEDISKENNEALVGKTFRVLCDEVVSEGRVSGKSNSTVEVEFDGDSSLIGRYVNVRIDRFTNVLLGTIV
ncbi:MAG: tRNA (N6-isopentenyl adenosine(37)-C2)-methylthiotransferase MiaB [Clostridia bacterium]|nr:tRNA (N6-isopentenyl adenosine(37)-C2)-methylthiotransferase MiaB [Clostridia bacterium]